MFGCDKIGLDRGFFEVEFTPVPETEFFFLLGTELFVFLALASS
jgi:hypothetical protein